HRPRRLRLGGPRQESEFNDFPSWAKVGPDYRTRRMQRKLSDSNETTARPGSMYPGAATLKSTRPQGAATWQDFDRTQLPWFCSREARPGEPDQQIGGRCGSGRNRGG